MSFPTSFGPAQSTLETTAETVANAGARAAGVKSAKPVYTVPTNSTLMGSVAMTALIGRVPIDGTVNDPYPFKILVGPDNLTANGIDIPDVAGAVFSGTASGDWTLSRSEEHTSELQSLMRISYAVFCLKKKIPNIHYRL